MVGLINLNVICNLILTRSAGILTYEAGHDLGAISTLLVLSNLFVVVEFVGYSKRPLELAAGVVIVGTSESNLTKGA
jgi:hypothetical protein